MEEFEFDDIDNIGTNIDKLKSVDSNSNNNIKNNNDMLKPKKKLNMNLFVKNLEKDLQNFKTTDSLDIRPSNATNSDMPNTKRSDNVINTINIETNKLNYLYDNIYFEVIIYMLVFMLLSHNIFNNITLFQSEYISLGVRTLLFGVIIFIIKKLNL
jgi:hypothetical protein